MKKTITYVIAPLIALALIILLLTSRLWLPDDRTNMTESYDQELMAGIYYLKISGAKYDTFTGNFTCTLLYGTKEEEKPSITFMAFEEDDKNDELSITITRLDVPEPLYSVVISGVPKDYYYVTIEARTTDKDGLAAVLDVSMDYRSAETIDTKNVVYVYVTPTPSPTSNPTPTPMPAP
jgi:hypothetical protein